MKKNDNVIVLTLGCSKNVVDSEKLIGMLSANGFTLTDDIRKAKTCIINTCGFIKPAVEENLQVVLDVVNRKIQGELERVIVSGCMVERFKESLINEFPEVDLFVGVESAEQIVRFLKPNEDFRINLIGERQLLTPNHYAYLKISEGCNRECSFCAIPKIRGLLRSKPIEELLDEAKKLSERGVKELIIISQDTSSYGVDLYGKPMLIPLLEELTKVQGIEWIRLMYLYPAGLPEGLIEFVRNEPKICKYFDIPLQHISDRILKSMRRGTTKKRTIELIEKIRTKIPNAVIRTTLIVGYPGETEQEFKELVQFISDYELDRVGVFTYFREDGTYAFPLGDTVPEDIKNLRREEILKLQSQISLRKNNGLVGKKLKVLIDEKKNGVFAGRTEFDAPEVDNLVYVRAQKHKVRVGDFVETIIARAKHYDLFGEVS
ncbi:30S ribosomal protein S12 methylthiotransferase RimO [Bacteroidetes/Chlorobi group bacterium Naka2016]|jgi:ribosomal protein S12 methylthiotransferase|nr:MAG: 30S ribosomal protein S12 methylthiotransferase RimO [Bacteroidetes/Chlorobi group bacterium Naka2016]